MNLQQMEYIVAVSQYHHFGDAAAKCKVSQPTLSAMIQKLEEELNVKLFDRSKNPIQPTEIGFRIIQQAEVALKEIHRIPEIISSQSEAIDGALRLGVIPTLAPYLIPHFIRAFREAHPTVSLRMREMQTFPLLEHLRRREIDMMLAATPLSQPDLLEIPIYYEKFVAYFSPDHLPKEASLSADKMPGENLWVLQEGHCMRSQVFNFCSETQPFNQIYEAGNIDTLVRIVDTNGGYSVIPELHIPYLSESQKKNICPIINPPATREVSLVIRTDYIREGLLNAVVDTLKRLIPKEMLDNRLKKFSVKL